MFTVFKTSATVCGLDGDLSELGAGRGVGGWTSFEWHHGDVGCKQWRDSCSILKGE